MNIKKQSLQAYIKSKKVINFALGKFEYDPSSIGEGGNGIAYKGKINNIDVAVKFLVLDDNAPKNKNKRFVAEYINVMNTNSLKNVVKYFNFEFFMLVINNDDYFEIPTIIMKLYNGDLKKWKKDHGKNQENFLKLFNFLLETVESIHNAGIIHRDIKPENILFDENGDLVLADFGIAHYNPQMFAIANLTKNGERVGNREFSAPEQEKVKTKVHGTMDIYAIGQVLQWFVTDNPHRGTGRINITNIVGFEDLGVYDTIISKCLNQDASKRFQSIQEIRDFIEKGKKKYPMNYIQKLHDIIQLSFPKAEENQVNKITDLVSINRFFNKLQAEIEYFGTHLYWKIGDLESNIERINIENNTLKFGLMNKLREFNIAELYLFLTHREQRNFILLRVEKNQRFENGRFEKYLYLDNEVTYEEFQKNIVEIEGKVKNVGSTEIVEIERKEDIEWVLISTIYNNSFTPEGGRKLTEKLFADIQNSANYEGMIEEYALELRNFKNYRIEEGGFYD